MKYDDELFLLLLGVFVIIGVVLLLAFLFQHLRRVHVAICALLGVNPRAVARTGSGRQESRRGGWGHPGGQRRGR